MRSILIVFLIILSVICACGCAKQTGTDTSQEPNVVQSEETSVAEVEDIGPIDPTQNLDKGNPEIGREYFYGENRGRCLACHTLYGEGEPTGYALDDAGLRREPEWLAVFIHNPRTLRSEVARMPPYRGDEQGATIADIVAFLVTLKTPVEHPESDDEKPENEPEPYLGGIGEHQSGHGRY